MAETSAAHRVSTFGAEAVAADVYLTAPLCAWEGDDGPRIGSAVEGLGASSRVLSR
jgi:hypothetical protein